MVSGITPCAQECKWIDYFGEPPKDCTIINCRNKTLGTPDSRIQGCLLWDKCDSNLPNDPKLVHAPAGWALHTVHVLRHDQHS